MRRETGSVVSVVGESSSAGVSSAGVESLVVEVGSSPGVAVPQAQTHERLMDRAVSTADGRMTRFLIG